MSNKKQNNTKSIWKAYCQNKQELIQILNLNNWIYLNENNFRDFLTHGRLDENEKDYFDFEKLEAERFWKLFDFANEYFEMDMILFEKFEKARLKK